MTRSSFLASFLSVGLGAAIGAWLRWFLGLMLNPLFVTLPLGTLTANLIGAYLIGIAIGVFHIHSGLPPALKLFVITGFLGGLTTFSSFAAEVLERLLAQQTFWALSAVALHVLGSLFFAWLGLLSVGAGKVFS
ncbi:MAG: fluoride efflux transporter CrcB [Betaproteobacteria bacterium]|nr:fluoride efflux transporter CrcB [Betaproteobacteria bacterium]